mmetsp:Transcript_14103/g.29816  ORF Transcript_14103/g.29816 Transcript_14103/m.29816 type:complete len:284 (-) Transcript_14103:390-1241(-)
MILHSLCITNGPLRTYKLFVRAYGGRSDENLDIKHNNTATLQKWINLYNIMLDNFKGQGHCVTINSVYMGDIMALIGRHEWKINVVGTAQQNQTGAYTQEEKKAMKKNMYEAVMWQHDSECLTYAICSDNKLVQTLSNFHTPKVVDSGLNRKKKVDGVGKSEPAPVPCPEQNINYSKTFHLIDKGNGVEAKYDLAGQSRKHGWTPKLSSRLFKMNFNNLYRIYFSLMVKNNPERRPLSMTEGIKEATHSLLQRGPTMRVWALEHPSPIRDMTYVYNTGSGKRK